MSFAIALLLQAAIPQTGAVPDPRSKEVIDLFDKMCVESAGSSASAHRLDSVPQLARPMTAIELHDVAPDAAATEGWIVRTPHDGWSALWFAPAKRTCGLTVREAAAAGMKQALEASFKAFFGQLGATVAPAKPDDTRSEDGVAVHTSSWLVTVGGHQMAIIASLGDKPLGAKQHLMTFTVLH